MTDSRPTSALHLEHAAPEDVDLGRALALVRLLRDRCPWDAEQTPGTLRPYLLEEAHEVADAIVSEDDGALLDELGDLLLNLAFQIVLAEERSAFTASEVVTSLERKMEARHPHVYGEASDPPDWEALKATERSGGTAGETDPFRGVSSGLDPLSRAARVQERMAAFGFDWDDLAGPLAKVREEADELERAAGSSARGAGSAAVDEEIGDLLFAVVNVARLAGSHPATALVRAIAKFEDRCRSMIRLAESRGIEWRTAGLSTLDRLWDEIKAGHEPGSGEDGSSRSA